MIRTKFTVLIITSLVVLLGISNLGLIVAESGVPSFRGENGTDAGGYITEIIDFGVDENGDSSFDNLYLNITLNLTVSGDYQIYADMSQSGVKASAWQVGQFNPGVHQVLLGFNGEDIYYSSRDGPYEIAISVNMGKDTLAKVSYTTAEYKYEDFNPAPVSQLDERASLEVINNTIKLKTGIFIAVIYELTPMIMFYYSTDGGQVARFKVTYDRVIAFSDQNEDGEFQVHELKYYGDLLTSNWNSQKVLMEDFNSFDFRVQTIVNLLDSTGDPIDTKLEIIFKYSSTKSLDSVSAAQKFDIRIKVLGESLSGITHISLEHTLEDETRNHAFLEKTTENENKISFITMDDKERGFYSWKNHFEISRGTRAGESENISYNMEHTSKPAVRKLYLNYPYSPDIIELFHDPTVGVNPSNAPLPPTPPPEEIIKHEILIYIVVAVIAGIIMLGSIYRQKKK
jgi:hypothetical protein